MKPVTLAQPINQHGIGERIAGREVNDDYVKSAGKLVRFDNVNDLRVPYGAKSLEDRRCPVCGLFCGGC